MTVQRQQVGTIADRLDVPNALNKAVQRDLRLKLNMMDLYIVVDLLFIRKVGLTDHKQT